MIDLHIHTIYSDGEFDEKQIVQKVIDANVTEFCICDHDSSIGSKKVYDYLKSINSNLIFHTGTELSCKIDSLFGGINVHLLVRDFDFNSQKVNFFIEDVANKRRVKSKLLIEAVQKEYNINFDPKKVENMLKNSTSFGKPHTFKLLSEFGDYDPFDFYKRMNKYKFTDLKLNAEEVVKSLKNEANVTLAHPKEIMEEYNLTYDDIDKIVKYLVNFGLYGLETRHSKHTAKDINAYEKIAEKYNIKKTCGSDYHGPKVKPNVFIGKCEKV